MCTRRPTPRRKGRLFAWRTAALVLLVASVPISSTPAAAGCPGTIRFIAGTGVWQTAANWDLNRLPDGTDDVCIPGGSSVTLSSGAQTIGSIFVEGGASLSVTAGSMSVAAASQVEGSFLLAGGTLSGLGEVSVNGAFSWTAGTMTGAGTTNANGGIGFSGTTVKDLTGGRVLNTGGTSTWSATGQIRLGSGGTIRNAGAWDVQGDASLSNVLGGAARFTNLAGGTFRKSAGTGTALVDLPFDNAGTVLVESGTLNLSAGGIGSGAFSGSPGTGLTFSDATYTLESASSLDAAAVSVANGTLDVFGAWSTSALTSVGTATLRFNPSATIVGFGTGVSLAKGVLTLNSGEPVALASLAMSVFETMLQGSDTVTVSGPINWIGGQMIGAGTVNANGGIVFSGTTTVKDISGGRVVNTFGTTIWQGAVSVRVGSGATIRNFGTWDVQVDATMFNLGGAAPRFVNQAGATFRKSAGTGTALVNIPFDNAGTVLVESGTLNLSAGGTGSGAFSGSAGTGFHFTDVTYTLASTSALDAAAVSVTSCTLDVFGTYRTSGLTGVNSATARFNPASTVLSFGTGVSLGNGTLNLNSGEPVDLATLSMSGFDAILTGPDPVTVTGPINLSAGQMTGAGTVNANGGLVVSGSSTFKQVTGGRVLNTYGTTTWTGTVGIRLGTGGTIRNFGTWDAQSDAGLLNLGGAAVRFFNEAGAVLQKSAGAGATSIQVPFENAGSVRVFAGTLSATAGYLQTGGSTSVEGGTLSSSTALDIRGGSLAGSGTVAANVVMQAARLSPGLSPGALAISGTYAQTAAGSFDVEIGGLAPGTEHDRAAMTGAVTLAGGLNVSLLDGFIPADFDTYTIMTFPSSAGTFAIANLPPLPGDLVWKTHYNPTSIVLEVLADLDGDGVRNLEDCAPDDPTAWSIPAPVAAFAFGAPGAGGPPLTWASLAAQAGPGIAYDVVRGLVRELPAGDKPGETCLVSGGTLTQATDDDAPEAGTGLYYLVRGVNVCGRGTYGTTSAGAERATGTCP